VSQIQLIGSQLVTTLCLSGGGFRATIFHAGVISALREMGMLGRIQNVVSVSGGSIAAAHLILNWARYTHLDDDVFRKAMLELLKLTSQDVRGRIVRRWILFGWIPRYRRLPQLVRCYDRLYRGTSLEDLDHDGLPKLYIASTSLVTGDRVYFGPKGMHFGSIGDPSKLVNMPNFPVAQAVAASSAFPPMFPPLALDPRLFGAELAVTERLADAGVFDNLGILAGGELAGEKSLLISDASASFRGNSWNTYTGTVSRTIRTTDILMSRVAKLDRESAVATKKNLYIAAISDSVAREDLNIGRNQETSLPKVVLSKTLQHWVPHVRTDLDAFSSEEVRVIFRHGYAVAAKSFSTLANCDIWKTVREVWDPVSGMKGEEADANNEALIREILNGMKQTLETGGPPPINPATPANSEMVMKQAGELRIGLWNNSDPLCWIVAGVLISVTIGGLFYLRMAFAAG
jgi:predicted acylesterase/phospholipase RssA